MMNHVMIDLETLDTTPTSVILSIGACFFDPNTGEIGKTFYEVVDWGQDNPEPVLNNRMCDKQPGRTISGSTVKWWREQSDEARADVMKNGIPLKGALESFRMFLGKAGRVKVWSNGSDFDNVIMAHAYEGNPPWKFWNTRCVRTIEMLNPAVKKNMSFEGTAHNALADAIHQAKYVSKVIQSLGSVKI